MKLQISFNIVDLDKAISIAAELANTCDILGVGPILLYKYGITAIAAFKKACPQQTVLADTRLVEYNEDIIPLLADAGTDWITILAGSTQETARLLCKDANKHNLKVLIDLVDSCYKAQSALEAKSLGADAVLLHQPDGQQEPSLVSLDTWEMVKSNASLPIFITTEINHDNLGYIVSLKPHTIVMGKNIIEHSNPAQEASYYYEILHKD